MIRVIVGTTTSKNTKNYAANTTIRNILEDNDIDYSVSQIMLDGSNIQSGDMDKTLEEKGIIEKCMLIAVVKASNA